MKIYKSKIQAIIFDWGGVCCSEGEPFASLALQKAIAMNSDQITDQVRKIRDGYYVGRYNRDAFWNAVLAHFHIGQSAELTPASLSAAYLSSYKIYPEIFQLLQQLRRKYKTGLLSNLTPEMRDHVRAQHELDKFFDIQVYSCDSDIAAMKPDNKPYLAVAQKLGVNPENCLFIDNAMKNVEAAQSMGMQAMFFKTLSRFLEEIKFLL